MHQKTQNQMPKAIPVNPALLRWARCTAGLSLTDAVVRAKITRLCKDEEAVTAEDRLASWEEGRTSPSFLQLKALAKAYCRPLVTFFLPEPPAQAADTLNASPEFAALKRRILQLHRVLCAIARDEQADALPFVNSCSIEDDVSTVVDAIRRTLDIEPLAERDDAFCSLRDKAQVAGVYVVLMDDSQVKPDEFRGIAIADRFAPLIVINKYDTTMLFTLAHELAHIFLGSDGISNAFGPHKSIEQFCNAVAAELLAPERLFHRRPTRSFCDETCEARFYFGRKTLETLRRAVDNGLITLQDAARTINMPVSRFEKIVE